MIIEIIMLFLMIGLNILVCYIYRYNKYFPIIFMIFNSIFALSLIEFNEIFVVFCVTFIIMYNFFIIEEQRRYRYV